MPEALLAAADRGEETAAAPAARKVLVVGSGFHFMSGISVYTCRLANELSNTWDVSVLLLDRLIPERFYPGRNRAGEQLSSLTYRPEVRMLGTIDWYWGRDIVRAVRALRQLRPEVVVLQWWTAATLHTYLALAAAAKRLGIPVIVEFHETQDPGEAGIALAARYSRLLLPRLLKLVSGAIVHNEHDLALLQTVYGSTALHGTAIRVAAHGPYDHYDVQPATDADPTPPDGVTRLLYFGVIRPYKGVEDLIRAFDGLSPEQAAQFTLTVVGETWEGWTEPAELIETSPYRDRITFVNRYVTDTEAGRFLAGADVMVLPYRRSSASGPLQIAMSAGLPVLLYAVGGLVEAVRDYRGAVLVPPNDVDALRSAILNSATLHGQRFEDPHSWAETVRAVTELTDECLASR